MNGEDLFDLSEEADKYALFPIRLTIPFWEKFDTTYSKYLNSSQWKTFKYIINSNGIDDINDVELGKADTKKGGVYIFSIITPHLNEK